MVPSEWIFTKNIQEYLSRIFHQEYLPRIFRVILKNDYCDNCWDQLIKNMVSLSEAKSWYEPCERAVFLRYL